MRTRFAVGAGALVASLLVQLTIVNGLQLPGGGVPDLVLLCVIAVGVVGGPRCGLLAGFTTGLALDVAPPAIDLVGQYALGFCLAGYASGMLRAIVSRSVVLTLAAAAAIAVTAEAFAACLSLVLGSPAVSLATVTAILPYSALYDVVVGPLVLIAAVRLAIALGVQFDAAADSQVLDLATPARAVGLTALPAARDRRYRRRAPSGRRGAPAVGWLTDEGSAIAFGPAGPVGARRPVRMAARRVPGRGWPTAYLGGSATATWGPCCRRGSSKGSPLSSVGSGLARAGRVVPRIAFGAGAPVGADRPSRGVLGGRPPRLVLRGVVGGRPPGLALRGVVGGPRGPAQRRSTPRIAFAVAGRSKRKGRAAVTKVARMRAGRRLPRWVPRPSRPGGRSTVWRIGSTRTVTYR